MYYPPGQDPYKSPDINRQDQFFHDLNRVQEQQLADMRRSNAASSPARAARTVAPPVAAGAMRVAPGRQVRAAAVPPDPRLQRRKAIVQLIVLSVLACGCMIFAGVTPTRAIGYTIAGAGAFILFALALSCAFGLIGRFFRSTPGRLTLVAAAGLALAYLYVALA